MQYLPKKQHHRWGIKLWVMCDSVVNYCLGFLYIEEHKKKMKRSLKKKMSSLHCCRKTIRNWELSQQRLPCLLRQFFFFCSLGKVPLLCLDLHHRNYSHQYKNSFKIYQNQIWRWNYQIFKNGYFMLCGYREKKSQKNKYFSSHLKLLPHPRQLKKEQKTWMKYRLWRNLTLYCHTISRWVAWMWQT